MQGPVRPRRDQLKRHSLGRVLDSAARRIRQEGLGTPAKTAAPPCRGHATSRSAASPRTSSRSSTPTTAGSPKVTCPSCSSTPSPAPSSTTESEPTSGHGRTKKKRQSPASTTSKRTAPTRSAPLSPTSCAGYARSNRAGSKPLARCSGGLGATGLLQGSVTSEIAWPVAGLEGCCCAEAVPQGVPRGRRAGGSACT
jgi:hypothetical protein